MSLYRLYTYFSWTDHVHMSITIEGIYSETISVSNDFFAIRMNIVHY